MNYSFISILLFSIILYAVSDDTLVTVHYDLSEPNVTLFSPVKGKAPLPIVDNVTKADSSVQVALTNLQKDGYYFQGWTDGVYGYLPGDALQVQNNMTLSPVFQKKGDSRKFYVEYYAEFEGEVIDVQNHTSSNFKSPNSIVTISNYIIQLEKAYSFGWTDGVNNYWPNQKFVVHEKNITFTPIWKYYRNLIFSGGDFDDFAGNSYVSFKNSAGEITDLTKFSMLARKGYENIGWVYNGVIYKEYDKFVMPDHDTIIYALWEADEYTIYFLNGVNSLEKIKIVARTGETITVPEINVDKEGYTFEGWKVSTNGLIYQPDEKYVVEGMLPGVGIRFDAVWNKK